MMDGTRDGDESKAGRSVGQYKGGREGVHKEIPQTGGDRSRGVDG